MPMRIYKSPDPAPVFPKQSLFSYLLPLKDPHADSPALIDALTGQKITRGQLQRDARYLAYGLRNGLSGTRANDFLNIPRFGTVLVFSGNSTLVPITILAGLCAGVVVSMASSAATAPELQYQIEDSAPSHIFVQPSLLGTAIAALRLIGVEDKDIKRRVILLARKGDVLSEDVRKEGLLTLEDIMADRRAFFPEEFDGEKAHRTAMLFYSSGTTGLPKGVELSHYNLVACVACTAAAKHIVPEEGVSPVSYGPIPMYHVYGGVVMVFYPMAKNVPAIVTPAFDPVLFLSSIEKYRITHVFIAPPIGAFLADSPLVSKYDITSLKSITCSAAPLSPTITAAMRKRLTAAGAKGIHIAQGFGATEMSPGVSLTPYRQDHKPAASGLLFGGIEARLVDDDGNDVEEGKAGELLLRGPNMMKGYLNKPEATRNTIKDGWLYSGDVATIDSEGFITIVDRKKELIKHSGYQVSPVEVENVLLKHPGVADTAVVGVKDARTGNELPRAYIVPRDKSLLKPGASTTAFEEEIKSYVKERMSHYKQLRGGVVLIDAIPKSAAGKVLRRELRLMIEKEVQEKAKL